MTRAPAFAEGPAVCKAALDRAGGFSGLKLPETADAAPAASPDGQIIEDWRHGGFGLYLHWPFCASKCPYCDFNSHVAEAIDQARWRAAYLGEISRVGAETRGRVLNTVFFGGGTPSLMAPDTVAAVLDTVRATWPMANDAEVTLEANPGSVEAGRFRAFAEAGVNRVSLGVQALNDADLRRLGRLHNTAEACAAFDIARETFGQVSFDLIYARQNQTLDDWRRELCAALSMAVDHLSLYQLTVEPGTVFAVRQAAGKLNGLPGDDLAADMYLITNNMCESAGLPAYEVSNHARPGAESRHNLIYWRGGDYAGIGPGAHGRLTLNGQRFATETPLSPALWLDQVAREGHGERTRQALGPDEQAAEYLMMGLRTADGIDLGRHRALSGAAIDDAAIKRLTDLDLLAERDGRLRATPAGRVVLNAILRELMP